MREPKISPLRLCDNPTCHQGIGKDTFKSSVIPGEFCSSDCYTDGVIDLFKTGGLKGRYKLETIRGGGVEIKLL